MNPNRTIFLYLADLLCILCALGVSSWFMLPEDWNVFADYTGASTFTLLTFFISFYTFNCYNIGKEDFRDSAARLLLAVIIGIIGTGFIFYSFENWRFPRMTFVFQMLIAFSLTLSWRGLYYHWLSKRVPKMENVIFLGSAKVIRAREVFEEYRPWTNIIGYVGEKQKEDTGAGPWLGEASALFDILREKSASSVVVLEPHYLSTGIAPKLLEAKLKGLKVDDMRGLYEKTASRVPVDLIEDSWLLLEDGFNLNANVSLRRLKRSFDICFSLPFLLLTLPLLAAAAACVKLESKGSVLYSQRRVGLNGREFTMYKIRSMFVDAEEKGPAWAGKDDPRITRVGRFIRKARIDELPQLFNVLKGEMSVVGPRPERKEFANQLAREIPYYNTRHTVKPGITGWAQVRYPYGASIEDSRAKLEYDLFYIKHLSVLLEIKIILKTIGVIAFPRGAR